MNLKVRSITVGKFLSRCFRRSAIAASIAAAAYLFGHDIITTNLTYSRDVSRILANHCLACHGAASSIPLTNYREVRPWAVAIKEQVLSRSMPPWGAVKGFGDLSPDQALGQQDIMIVAAWVIGGAPEGNPQMLPRSAASSSLPPMATLRDVLTISTRCKLTAPVRLAGIRPLADSVVPSARLLAELPDGRIEPLLWLYRFDPKSPPEASQRAFTFRKFIDLPRGTIIESSAPLRFSLETEHTKAPLPGS